MIEKEGERAKEDGERGTGEKEKERDYYAGKTNVKITTTVVLNTQLCETSSPRYFSSLNTASNYWRINIHY